jgi:GntR family transcriptional regulator / MocR family aminotransferase
MSSLALGVSPLIALDRKSATPLHKQIYDEYRAAILRGDLRPGQQVPPTRELAIEIRVSRFPVVHAYTQLRAEGYFESRVGAGTFVSTSLPEQLMSVARQEGPSIQVRSGPRRVAHRSSLFSVIKISPSMRGLGAFGVHQPAFDEFPYQIWSNLIAGHSRNPNARALHNPEPLGSERFRRAICSYLSTARGVKCEPSQIMVVSGSQQALDIAVRVLLDPGSPVWVEEPGYRLARTLLTGAGCRLIPVPVDREGMNIAAGIKRRQDARAAFVTPSHQYPLGSTMSASRRLQLLNWAQSSGAWVVEDDYDSEYRYETEPIPSLQGLDVNERVIYIGSFSKVLLPSLRIGYIVIPSDLVQQFVAVRMAMDIIPPFLYQEVLTDFIHLGHFARHVRKMRRLYSDRRTELAKALQSELGDMLQIHGVEAGMHLTVTLPDRIDDQEIAQKAAGKGLWLWPLSPSYFSKKVRQGLILGFGSTPTNQITRAVHRLRSVLIE